MNVEDLVQRGLAAQADTMEPTPDLNALLLRGETARRQRRRIWYGATSAAIALVLVAVVTGWLGLKTDNAAPAGPTEGDDIFADVHGWIVYGEATQWTESGTLFPGDGIWAINPTQTAEDTTKILVTKQPGKPLEWSRDGTQLLLRRAVPGQKTDARWCDLIVLHADGSETWVAKGTFDIDGSFSSDGSQVVYSSMRPVTTNQPQPGDGMWVADLDEGTRRLLLPLTKRRPPGGEQSWRTDVYHPVFSPDGSRIAYFDGMGDWGHSLRVMRSDGTDIQVLFDGMDEPSHVEDLVWSPDGQRLAFTTWMDGLWIIRVDGSGLTKLAGDAINPAWSPDGTSIAYQPTGLGELRTVDLDGTHHTKRGSGGSGPWNPLPLVD